MTNMDREIQKLIDAVRKASLPEKLHLAEELAKLLELRDSNKRK